MKGIAAVISAFVLLAVSCQFPGDLAGGSASEGEARVVGWAIGRDGGRAADAQVKVRPAGYLKDTSASSILALGGRIRDLRTDSSGRFVIDTLDTGVYAITILDRQSFSALIRCHISKDTSLGYTTLMPSGTITGSIDPFSEKSMYRYVQVYDIDCASPIDSLTGEFILSDIPQGIYVLRLLPVTADTQPAILDSIDVTAGARAMVQTGAWVHAARIFLNTTSDGAGVNDDVYDFPVLVRLTGNNFDFSQAGTLGNDIRFAQSDGVPLSFEIERWDSSSSAAEIWVRMDTVLGNNDTQYFLVYWGNSHSAASSNSASVFDTAKGFQGVWHFGSIRNGTCADATLNGYQGSLSAVVPVQGVIGAAYLFDGVSSHITLAQTAASTLNFPQGGTYAISAWVNAGDSSAGFQNIVAKGYAQYTLRISSGQWQFIESEGRVPMECEMSQAPATYGEWVHLVAVRNGAEQYFYVNGICADSTIDFVQGIGVRLETYDVEIGRTVFPDSDTTPREYFNGLMDEVRLSTAVPSSAWIKLCYMNQRADDVLVVVEQNP